MSHTPFPNHLKLQAISLLLANNPSILRRMFGDRFEILFNQAQEVLEWGVNLPKPEQILLRLALDVWSGDGGATLGEVISELDHCHFEGLLLALECLRYSQNRPQS